MPVILKKDAAELTVTNVNGYLYIKARDHAGLLGAHSQTKRVEPHAKQVESRVSLLKPQGSFISLFTQQIQEKHHAQRDGNNCSL